MRPTTLVFLATSFLAALAIPLQQRAVSNIVADITDATSQLNAMEAALKSLTATGGDNLNVLENHANLLITDFQKAVSDVGAHGAISEADGQTIVATNEIAAKVFIDVLDLYVSQKPVFDQLAKIVPNLIPTTENSLQNIANGLAKYISIVEANAPADVTAEDADLRSSAMAAVGAALTTFQS